jgi:hypothetical protein
VRDCKWDSLEAVVERLVDCVVAVSFVGGAKATVLSLLPSCFFFRQRRSGYDSPEGTKWRPNGIYVRWSTANFSCTRLCSNAIVFCGPYTSPFLMHHKRLTNRYDDFTSFFFMLLTT